MRPDLPWNVAGIPPEAREAARAAARREGLSVGEWLTRRILRSLSEVASDQPNGVSEDWWEEREEKPASRRDTEEMLAHVSRTENEAQNAYRRIEEQLRTFARRMDAAERSQTENTRAMSKAAAEINVATREQAQAFDLLGSSVTNLSDRLDRVERHASADHLRDAVKGLHQGLTRVADQVSQTANHSATQISSLADNLESVAGRMTTTRQDLDAVARAVDSRHAHMEDRLRGVEKLVETNADDITRVAANTSAVARLEASIGRLEGRTTDPAVERRLSGIERTLSDVAARLDSPDRSNALADEKLRALTQRLDASEKTQRETVRELRTAIAALAPQPEMPKPVVSQAPFLAAPSAAPLAAGPQPQHPAFDSPPFADDVFPPNAPRPSRPMDSFGAPPFAAVAAAVEAPMTDQAAPADPFPPLAAFGDGTAAVGLEQADSFLDVAAPLVQPDTFLAAARRSAQAAAAQAEAERLNRGFGGFAWATQGARAGEPRSRYGLVGLVVLAVVLLAVAGILFSQRLPSPEQTTSDLPGALAGKQSAPVVLKPTTPAGETSVVPLSETPAPAVSSQAPVQAPAAPRVAPSSPVLPAKTHRVVTAPLPPSAQAKTATAKPAAPVQQERPAPKQPTHEPPKQIAAMPLDRLTQLANSGNAKAETIVGLRYLEGNGVPANEAESAKWLERAANQGQAVAQYRLGTLYERGRGVATDGAKALHWYQAAAQAGNRKAMHNLAVAYAQGTGVQKDFAEAARWFSKAAALGLADSQFNLAVLYERGLGVPQSLLDAYKWYAIAAAQGDAESKSRIGAIATQLSADDRAAAQRSADQFKPAPLDASANVPPQLGDISG
jgi:localization factor PodJL